MKLAESSEGEIDGVLTSPYIDSSFSTITFNNEGIFVNYTRVYELYEKEYNLSPRKYTCSATIGSDLTHLY